MISTAEAVSFRRRAVDGEMPQLLAFEALNKLRCSVAADVILCKLIVETFFRQSGDLTLIVDIYFDRFGRIAVRGSFQSRARRWSEAQLTKVFEKFLLADVIFHVFNDDRFASLASRRHLCCDDAFGRRPSRSNEKDVVIVWVDAKDENPSIPGLQYFLNTCLFRFDLFDESRKIAFRRSSRGLGVGYLDCVALVAGVGIALHLVGLQRSFFAG